MSDRLGGTATIAADGQRLKLSGNFTCCPSGVKREMKTGPSGVAGYVETPMVPFFEGEAYLTKGVNVKDLIKITNGTVTAKIGDREFSLTGAIWANPPEHGIEGTFPFRFEGEHGEYL